MLTITYMLIAPNLIFNAYDRQCKARHVCFEVNESYAPKIAYMPK